MSSRDSLHAKVRAILEKANHPTTPQAEAETALALAFRLMQKYDLDEDAVSGRQARDVSNHEVKSKVFVIKGPYRVRRGETASDRAVPRLPLEQTKAWPAGGYGSRAGWRTYR